MPSLREVRAGLPAPVAWKAYEAEASQEVARFDSLLGTAELAAAFLSLIGRACFEALRQQNPRKGFDDLELASLPSMVHPSFKEWVVSLGMLDDFLQCRRCSPFPVPLTNPVSRPSVLELVRRLEGTTKRTQVRPIHFFELLVDLRNDTSHPCGEARPALNDSLDGALGDLFDAIRLPAMKIAVLSKIEKEGDSQDPRASRVPLQDCWTLRLGEFVGTDLPNPRTVTVPVQPDVRTNRIYLLSEKGELGTCLYPFFHHVPLANRVLIYNRRDAKGVAYQPQKVEMSDAERSVLTEEFDGIISIDKRHRNSSERLRLYIAAVDSAMADEKMTPDEQNLLGRIAHELGLSEQQIKQVHEDFGVPPPDSSDAVSPASALPVPIAVRASAPAQAQHAVDRKGIARRRIRQAASAWRRWSNLRIFRTISVVLAIALVAAVALLLWVARSTQEAPPGTGSSPVADPRSPPAGASLASVVPAQAVQDAPAETVQAVGPAEQTFDAGATVSADLSYCGQAPTEGLSSIAFVKRTGLPENGDLLWNRIREDGAPNRVLVLGGPGSGKSWLAKGLRSLACVDGIRSVLLGNWLGDDGILDSVTDAITPLAWLDRAAGFEAGTCGEADRAGPRWLVVVDDLHDLDEDRRPALYSRLRKLEALLGRRLHLVVLSRPVLTPADHAHLRAELELEIAPLSCASAWSWIASQLAPPDGSRFVAFLRGHAVPTPFPPGESGVICAPYFADYGSLTVWKEILESGVASASWSRYKLLREFVTRTVRSHLVLDQWASAMDPVEWIAQSSDGGVGLTSARCEGAAAVRRACRVRVRNSSGHGVGPAALDDGLVDSCAEQLCQNLLKESLFSPARTGVRYDPADPFLAALLATVAAEQRAATVSEETGQPHACSAVDELRSTRRPHRLIQPDTLALFMAGGELPSSCPLEIAQLACSSSTFPEAEFLAQMHRELGEVAWSAADASVAATSEDLSPCARDLLGLPSGAPDADGTDAGLSPDAVHDGTAEDAASTEPTNDDVGVRPEAQSSSDT